MKFERLNVLQRTNRQGASRGRLSVFLTGVSAIGLLLIELSVLLVQISPLDHVLSFAQSAPVVSTAIVLGASIVNDREPSDALSDRLETARGLYTSGKVKKLLLSGDGGAFHANEVAVMQRVLLERGVPPSALLLDTQGFRTYESCKRAREVFGVHEAIIVTQRFHMARSLFLCEHFGIEVVGVSADRQRYKNRSLFSLRELGASVKAVIDLFISPPNPPVSL